MFAIGCVRVGCACGVGEPSGWGLGDPLYIFHRQIKCICLSAVFLFPKGKQYIENVVSYVSLFADCVCVFVCDRFEGSILKLCGRSFACCSMKPLKRKRAYVFDRFITLD